MVEAVSVRNTHFSDPSLFGYQEALFAVGLQKRIEGRKSFANFILKDSFQACGWGVGKVFFFVNVVIDICIIKSLYMQGVQ